MACVIRDDLIDDYINTTDSTLNADEKGKAITRLENEVDGLITECNLSNDADVSTDVIKSYDDKIKLYESAHEQNKDSTMQYLNDYYYIIFKSVIYIVVLGIVIYFFGISKLIESVKTSATFIKEKIKTVKEKVEQVGKVEPKLL